MPISTFYMDDFSLSSSWAYQEVTDDTLDVTIDYLWGGDSDSVTKSFDISGIDLSIVNSVTLTWTISASSYGTIQTPTAGYGYTYAKVYNGTDTSGPYAAASSRTFDLTQYVESDGKINLFFYYQPGIYRYDHNSYKGFGLGNCTGTVYFKNITLTVTYGEEQDDDGMGALIGIDNVAHSIKNLYVGVSNQARQVKAAWIGVGGIARLFYQSSVTLPVIDSRYNTSGTATTSGTTLYARNPSTGYAACVFDGSTKFASFTKATLYVYITGNGSTSTELTTWLRNGADNWIKYNANLDISYRTIFSDSSTGLHAYDITTALKDLYLANNAIVTNGIKVYFRSYNNIKIAGHANTSYQTPYILVE